MPSALCAADCKAAESGYLRHADPLVAVVVHQLALRLIRATRKLPHSRPCGPANALSGRSPCGSMSLLPQSHSRPGQERYAKSQHQVARPRRRDHQDASNADGEADDE